VVVFQQRTFSSFLRCCRFPLASTYLWGTALKPPDIIWHLNDLNVLPGVPWWTTYHRQIHRQIHGSSWIHWFQGVASLRSPLLGLLGFFPGRIMLSAFDALKRSERRLSDLLFGSHLEGIRKPPQETKKGKVWNNLTETISLNPNLLEENVCLPWSCRSLLGATMAMHKIPLRCSWSGYPSTAANENHPTSSDLPSNKSR
jgi:hypothetical protein